MKFPVTRSLRPVRLALPVAAALTALGGGLATAAPSGHGPAAVRATAAVRPGSAQHLSWHALALDSGWKSVSTASLKTGRPGWALRDGVIYLRGAVKQTNPSAGDAFATLPAAARPPHDIYRIAYSSQETPAEVYVGHSGKMAALGGNSTAFTSLAAISYPTAAIRTHPLALKNGWQSDQPIFGTGNPAYAVSHGVVYLSGSLHGGTSQVAFTLPEAARPAHQMYVLVYTLDDTFGWLRLLPAGQVEIGGLSSSGYTSLAGISFPVAGTAWHRFKPEAGWHSGASRFGTANPSYAAVNGVVYLDGSIYQSGGSTGLWTQVPAPARAADVLEIEVYTADGTAGAVAMADNAGLVASVPFSDAQQFTSLAGIAYPPSS